MPGVRGENQTLITCPMDAELLSEIEVARGSTSRSQFIREALAEKLESLGIKVDANLINPPDRAGKGGRPKKIEQQIIVKGRGRVGKVVQKKLSTGSAGSACASSAPAAAAGGPRAKEKGKGKGKKSKGEA